MNLQNKKIAGSKKSLVTQRLIDLQHRLKYFYCHPTFQKARLRTVIRILAWRIRCWLGISVVIDFPRWGARFFLPARWGGEGTTMIFATREEYENELAHLEHFISPGDVFVDAGANCGVYTIAAAKLVGDAGKVIAFEPGARVASVLQNNIELNRLNNVRLYRNALSDREGKARLYHHRGTVASSIAAAGDGSSDQYDEVTSTTLDSLFHRQEINRIDVLKMDIEGAEELALRGAASLLTISPPVIIFEMNHLAATRLGLHGDGAWRYLKGLDYRFFELSETSDLLVLHSPPADEEWGFRNVIAVPKANIQRFLNRWDGD